MARLALRFALTLFAIGGLAPAHAAVHQCSNANVSIEAASFDEGKTACTGASAAMRFLADEGLDVSGRVRLSVVSKLPAGNLGSSAGCYLPTERCAFVLNFPEYMKLGVVAEGRISEADYLGLIAHEVAHVIAGNNFKPQPPSILAQEYVACVTQYATMPPDEREISLSKFPGSGFDAPREMSLTGYMLSPGWFCAQAYRHYLKPGNGRTFLRNVVDGVYPLDE